MFCSHGHTGEHGGQQGEYECLDEGDDAFQQSHENIEDQGYDGNAIAETDAHSAKDEDERDDAEGDDMAGGDVGKKSHHQHERLGEDSDDFHHRHQRDGELEEPRHAGGVDQMLPIVAVSGERGDQEGDGGQDAGNGDVAGDIGAAGEDGDESHQVVDQNEEEKGEQVGEVFLVFFLSQGRNGHLVPDEENERFQQPLKTVGRFSFTFFVLFGNSEENPEEQQDGDEEGADILRDGNVIHALRARFVNQFVESFCIPFADAFLFEDFLQRLAGIGVGGGQFHDFALVFLRKAEGVSLVAALPVFELAGHEHMATMVNQNDGKWYGNRMVPFTGDVPAVAVHHMFKDERSWIE